MSTSQSTTPPLTTPFKPWQPRAHFASPSSYDMNAWLLDFGATHHITSDLNNLSLHHPYNGGDDVVIADGSTVAITHTGSKLLSSKTRVLKLDNTLCVPNIHKKLIFVYACVTLMEFMLISFLHHFR